MWVQLGLPVTNDTKKDLPNIRLKKKEVKNTTFYAHIRCHFPGRDPAADGFSGTFQLWCGVAGLILDISGHQVHISRRTKEALFTCNLAGCTLLNGWFVDWNYAQFTKCYSSTKGMASSILTETNLHPPISWL